MWIGACTVRLYPVGEPASNRSPLPLFDAGLSDLLGQVVDHFSLVTRHFKVGGAQKLVLAVEQGFTNALLHPRVAQGALAGWFAREDLEHTVAAVGLDNWRYLPGRNTENSSHVGAGFFERRLGHKTEVAPIGSALRIFGEILRQHAEILTLVDARFEHVNFLLRLIVGLRFVVFQITHIGVGL